MRSAWKEILKGALQAIGAIGVGTVAGLIALLKPQVVGWAIAQHPSPEVLRRTALTIFLAVSTIALLVLFVHSRVELFRLRRRIVENRLTLADMAGGHKPLMKAVDKLDKP
jgi:hypothetical protein